MSAMVGVGTPQRKDPQSRCVSCCKETVHAREVISQTLRRRRSKRPSRRFPLVLCLFLFILHHNTTMRSPPTSTNPFEDDPDDLSPPSSTNPFEGDDVTTILRRPTMQTPWEISTVPLVAWMLIRISISGRPFESHKVFLLARALERLF